MGLWIKKRKKYKYVNGCRGAVAIFLCLVITPFLTIASALLEYSRYQGAAQEVKDLMNTASYSTLSNYDTYLEERFGVFAISKDCDINSTYQENVSRNTEILGKSIIFNGNTAKGEWPLSEQTILKKQIMDFSESTVMADFLLDDMNIEELIEKLSNLKGIESLVNTTEKVAGVTSGIVELVEKIEGLKESVEKIANKAVEIKNKWDDFIGTAESTLNKIKTGGYVYDEADPAGSLELLVSSYGTDIQNIYTAAEDLKNNAEAFKNLLEEENLPQKLNDVKTAYEAVVQAWEGEEGSTEEITTVSIESGEQQESEGASNASEEVSDVLQEILDAVKDAVDEAVETFKQETVDNFKTSAEELVTELKSKFKLDTNGGQYVKDDLQDLIISLLESEDIRASVAEKYLPEDVDFTSISSTISSTADIIKTAFEQASNSFQEKMGDSLGTILNTLVTALRGLFDLDVFYDGDLDAYLDDAIAADLLTSDTGNPYSTFLTAMENMVQGVESFVGSIAGLNLAGMLKALGTLLTAINNTLKALCELAVDTVHKVQELAGYLTSGEDGSLYELLLLSAYLTHTLPSRNNAGSSFPMELEGTAITGFDYADIPETGGSAGALDILPSGLTGMVSFLNGLSGGGSDKMFKGAELEYAMIGTKSEIANQALTFLDLYILRILIDLPVVLTDPAVAEMAAAATIAGWAVYLIVALGEPLCDAVILGNGETSYLVKKGCYLTPKGIPKLIETLVGIAMANGDDKLKQQVQDSLTSKISGKMDGLGSKPFTEGGIFEMDYDTHLLLLLMLTTTEERMLGRLADLMQLENNAWRRQEGLSDDFRITQAYTTVSAETDLTFQSFIRVFEINDSSVFRKKFSMMRSY